MKHNPQIKKMQGFPDEELLNVLENWQSFASDSVRAALVLAEERGLEIEKFRDAIQLKEVPQSLAWYETERFDQVFLWVLAVLQIGSGVFGYFFSDYPNFLSLLFISLILLLSIASGILLLSKRKLGLIFSGINFLLQVLIIQISGSGLKYFTGLRLGLGLNPSNGDFALFADFGMALRLGQIEAGAQTFLGINFFALIALLIIGAQLKREREKRSAQQ
ncbi:MAG: hypothetical protein AAF927_22085 [Bacteroidota bacterium]